MTGYMNIVVRVMADKAKAAMAQVAGSTKALQGQMAAANAMPALGTRQMPALAKWGNQLQWTGRQLQYNFSLPLAIAAGAAVNWQLANEKAFTRVAKVYGDLGSATDVLMKKHKGWTEGMAEQRATEIFANELAVLDEAFVALSNHYGVAQSEVTEIAGAWAAAGQSGLALAHSVESTLQAMILGELDAAKATDALIAIQAQYNLSSQELTDTLSYLNVIENQTGISMGGLIDGLSRAAGVSREAGIEVRELSAMMAALVPATGSAASAGNALKTIISRVMSPTKEAAQVMEEMGLEINQLSWNAATGQERLHMMSDAFMKLDSSQRSSASATIASRWQVNRFSILMKELAPGMSYYERALEASADRTKTLAVMTEELNTVLTSNPQRLQQIWVMLQNAMANVVQPLIPYILYLADAVADLMTAFANMNPTMQHFILMGLTFLALIGPVTRYIGSLGTLFGTMGRALQILAFHMGLTTVAMVGAGGAIVNVRSKLALLVRALTIGPFVAFGSAIMGVFTALSTALGAVFIRMFAGILGIVSTYLGAMAARITLMSATVVGALVSPWVLAGVAIGAALYALRDQFVTIWNNIVGLLNGSNQTVTDGFNNMVSNILNAFYALPQGVQDAMIAVVTVVRDAALAVYDWFSYINPWAQHSPSLVDNVRTGVAAVNSAFGNMSVGNSLSVAYADIKRFNSAMQEVTRTSLTMEQAEERAEIAKWAPQALGAYDALIGRLRTLNGLLGQVGNAVTRQEGVVESWQGKVDAATAAIERQQVKLDELQGTLDTYQARLSAAQQALTDFSNTPLQGEQRFDNAIFSNSQAQAALQLKILKAQQRQQRETVEEAKDYSKIIDRLQEKLSGVEDELNSINGAQELLSGKKADLRAAGAGSEILNQYDAEIKKLKEREQEVESQADKYRDRIKALERERDAIDETGDSVSRLERQLEKLQRRGQILELEKQLKFDALRRKIEQAADSTKEMTFEEIMTGIRNANRQIEKYGPLVDSATEAVEAQKNVVERHTRARDRLAKRLDLEQNRLDRLNEKYQRIEGTVRDVEQALQGASRAAAALSTKMAERRAEKDRGTDPTKPKPYVSPGLESFRRAEGGNFPDPGGTGGLGREGFRDESSDITDFTNTLAQDTAAMFAKFNPFRPLIAKARSIWSSIKAQFIASAQVVWSAVRSVFAGVEFPNPLEGKGDEIFGRVTELAKGAGEVLKNVWELIGPELEDVLASLVQGFQDAAKWLAPIFKDIGPVLKDLWAVVKVVLIGGLLWVLMELNIWLNIIAQAAPGLIAGVAQLLQAFFLIFKGVLQVITGLASFIVNIGKAIWSALKGVVSFFKMLWSLITFDFEGVAKHGSASLGHFGDAFGFLVEAAKAAWKVLSGIGNIFVGVFGAIFVIVARGLQFVWNVVEGFVKGVVGFFRWLYDILVGHSIVPDLVNGIIASFEVLVSLAKWIWNNILKPVVGVFRKLWSDFIKPALKAWWDGFKSALSALVKLAGWVWDKILKPVFNTVREVWQKFIKPALKAWWEGFKTVLSGLKNFAEWMWDKVLKPVWNWIKKVWQDYIKPSLRGWWDAFKTVLKGLLGFAKWMWDRVLKPVWERVKKVWNDYIKPALRGWWDAFKTALKGILGFAKWMWDRVLKPVWERVKKVWNDYIKPGLKNWWEGFKTVLAGLLNFASWMWTNVLKPLWGKFQEVWSKIKPILRGIASFVRQTVAPALRTAIEKIKNIWDNLLNIFKAPVRFLVNVVYNKGIVPLVNAVAKAVGLGGDDNKVLDTYTPGWLERNRGGPIPGTGNKDTVPAMLTPGEFVQKKAAVAREGTAKMQALNEGKATIQYFAKGGVVWPTEGRTVYRTAYNLGHDGMDINGPGDDEGDKLFAARKGRISYTGWGRGYGDSIWMNADTGHELLYGHTTNSTAVVRKGQSVSAGQHIGYLGNTGRSTGPHLHFGVYPGGTFYASEDYLNGAITASGTASAGGGSVAGTIIRGIADLVPDWVKKVAAIRGDIATMGKDFGSGVFNEAILGVPKMILNNVIDWAKDKASNFVSISPVGGVDKYEQLVRATLPQVGSVASEDNIMRVLTQMEHESGGDPNIVNKWDSNWDAGHPSVGLMQVIGPTYDAYKHPDDVGPFKYGVSVDPASNIYASLNYATATYGSIPGAFHPPWSGYNDGGLVTALRYGGIVRARRGGTLIRAGEAGQDEAVVPLPNNWRNGEGGGGDTFIFHGDLSFPNITNGSDAEDFIENLRNLARD